MKGNSKINIVRSLELLIKGVILTFLIGIIGILVFGLGSSASGSEVSIIGVFGIVLFLGSPFIAIYVMRYFSTKRTKALAAEKENAAKLQKDLQRRSFLERQRLIDAVDRHRSAIVRNLERAVRKNDYGAVVEDKRLDALGEFFASIDLDFEAVNETEAVEVVLEQLNIRKEEEQEAGFNSNDLPFDGHAFEKWVADALAGFGWTAEVTGGSGDQGIDVIAEIDGLKIGLQCKLYSSAIGNKAVQEAHSGKVYYGLDMAGVISNANFTASAKDLAAVTGILLLSHHDIPSLADKVRR
ncbi:MAG: restriction endonuclease [Opitutales bacterium]